MYNNLQSWLAFPTHDNTCSLYYAMSINPIRSGGGGGALKAPPSDFFALTHLILELHYCALVTFPKK